MICGPCATSWMEMPPKCMDLSERYRQGEQGKRGKRGVQQNEALAANLCFFAAVGGHKEAQFKYGKICERDDPDSGEAEQWYRRAVEQGQVDAMFALGRLFYWKEDASPEDLAEAEKWLRRAAAYEYARAQYMLGHMYVNNKGVLVESEGRAGMGELPHHKDWSHPVAPTLRPLLKLPGSG